jgi:putative intracellular protease/amidase
MALKDRTVAILVGAGTPAAELNPVQQALTQAGAEVILVGPTIEDLERHVLSQDLTVSIGLGIDAAKQVWFDAVVIPGGATVEDYCGLESVYDFLGTSRSRRSGAASCCSPTSTCSTAAAWRPRPTWSTRSSASAARWRPAPSPSIAPC